MRDLPEAVLCQGPYALPYRKRVISPKPCYARARMHCLTARACMTRCYFARQEQVLPTKLEHAQTPANATSLSVSRPRQARVIRTAYCAGQSRRHHCFLPSLCMGRDRRRAHLLRNTRSPDSSKALSKPPTSRITVSKTDTLKFLRRPTVST